MLHPTRGIPKILCKAHFLAFLGTKMTSLNSVPGLAIGTVHTGKARWPSPAAAPPPCEDNIHCQI